MGVIGSSVTMGPTDGAQSSLTCTGSRRTGFGCSILARPLGPGSGSESSSATGDASCPGSSWLATPARSSASMNCARSAS
eukprot:6710830-Prymnesium_polylepis.1